MGKWKTIALPDLKTKTRKCRRCNGRGVVLSPAMWPMTSHASQCGDCHGRGQR